MRVKEILLEGLESLRPGTSASEAIDRAESAVNLCGLRSDSLYRYPHEFSGGQRQRLAIARALLVEPELLICDEPTSALDPEMVGEVLDLMKSLAKEGMTMIIVTHEMAFARDVSDQLIFMDDGRVVEQGRAQDVIGDPQHERTRVFLANYQQG